VVSQDGQPAQVRSVEHLGADSIVLCEIGGQPILVRQDGFSKLRPGDIVRLDWTEGDEHQFDPATGLRVAAATGDIKQVATG
jgi:sn-glycerol 3-phosphate transport system ATP-binding protein